MGPCSQGVIAGWGLGLSGTKQVYVLTIDWKKWGGKSIIGGGSQENLEKMAC